MRIALCYNGYHTSWEMIQLPFYYWDSTILILLPGILLVLFAQIRVQSTFKRYQRVQTQRGVTAEQTARQLLDDAGLQDVPIERVAGSLSDHYDPRSRTLRLSEVVAASTSVASVGVAAHEVGHAIQHAREYTPLTVRNAIYPVVNIASSLAIPLLLLGFVLELSGLVTAALILYASVLVFQLITLPVEYNASSRAKALLADGYLTHEEVRGAGKVLSAAAMTYLASTLMALLQFLRLVAIARSRD